jgi:5S rRNA maturation endonuclease (ribonuclease M5)
MRYADFTIKNFRGIKELSLDLSRDPHTTVHTLVGLNESGKSTILHALNWMREPSIYNSNDLIPKAQRANFNGEISVLANVTLSPGDEDEIRAYLDKEGLRLESEISTFRLTRRFEYRNSTRISSNFYWSLVPLVKPKKGRGRAYDLKSSNPIWTKMMTYITDLMLPPIVYYENFLFDIPDRIYLERVGKELTAEDVVYRQVVQDVLASLGIGLTIEAHLLTRHRSGKRADLDNIQAVLDDASAQLTDVVITAWREIVKSSDQKLEVSLGSGVDEDETGTFLQLKVKEGKQTFYIRERSLGFRWFFGFILFTHFRTYRDNSRRNALFLLDEPASNLHPAAQTKLLSAFASLPNNQLVIYSTHSHHMIKPEWLAGAYVVRNAGQDYEGLDLKYNAFMTDVKAERYFHFAAHHPKDSDLYRPILEALEYRPGPLEKIPDMVIVEGKNDYYTLRYLSEIVGLGKTRPLHVYPSTGKDKIESIVSLYLGWGRNFLVLLDGDKGGRETAAKLKKTFGSILDDRVFTLADIDPDWAGGALESLFDVADRDAVTASVFPGTTYDKGRFNTAIQANLISSKEQRFSKSTKSRFQKVFSLIDAHIRG